MNQQSKHVTVIVSNVYAFLSAFSEIVKVILKYVFSMVQILAILFLSVAISYRTNF